MRLEIRVTLWLLVLLGAAAAVNLFGMARFHEGSLEHQARETGRLLALSVESSLEVSMLNNDPEDIRSSVENLKKGTYIESVVVYGHDGTPWVASSGALPARTEEREALATALRSEGTATSSRDGLLGVFVPIRNDEACIKCHADDPQVLGAVGVTIDKRPIQHGFATTTRNSLFIVAIPLVAGLLASLWSVRRSLLVPLRMLGRAADTLAAGNFAVRLPTFRAKEFGSVASAFNDMAARLERQAANLTSTVEQLRSDLEGMEEIQTLMTSGAGLDEILTRTAGHLGPALAASGVGIWRTGSDRPAAHWGDALPPEDAIWSGDGGVRTSAGPIDRLPESRAVSWVVAPALRGGRTLALVGAAWSPARALAGAERDLFTSFAGLIAVAVENAELLDRLKKEEQSLEVLLKKTLAAQEEERRRVARELHDETSQIIHALMMNIDVLERQPGGRALRSRLKAVKAMAEEAGRNLDKVMLDLRPALLDELGLIPALRWYVSQIQEAWGLPAEFKATRMRRAPEHVEVAAFRIAQEAVSNAVRHGQPSRIWVSVRTAGENLVVEVRDDGQGFDLAEAAARARLGDAAGMLGMKERAELLGGHLVVDSVPGEGTTVVAEIPLGVDPTVAEPEAAVAAAPSSRRRSHREGPSND